MNIRLNYFIKKIDKRAYFSGTLKLFTHGDILVL